MRVKICLMVVIAWGSTWVASAAEDPPTPGGFLLRSEATAGQAGVAGFPKPYSAPCTERENIFEFAEKPAVKVMGNDKYEITFAVKGNCDVAVGIVDPSTGSAGSPQASSGQAGVVVRHLGSGVLGANAPAPFQKNSLKQTIYWNGKDDLGDYHKTPEKLRVRVMLGLKPEFDKRLGGKSPKNLPGLVWGFAASEEGVFVISAGRRARLYVRQFDHDAKYGKSLVPPPANLPEEKLGGMSFVEYEPGKKALIGRDVYSTISSEGGWLFYRDRGATDCQPVIVGNRLYYTNAGGAGDPPRPSFLHSIHTDGSTDYAGVSGRALKAVLSHPFPRFAVSPDGKWMYMTGLGGNPIVLRFSLADEEGAKPFLGRFTAGKFNGQVGSDEVAFSNPRGLDCDPQGRILVADQPNNRVQVFTADGKFFKTIPCDRPYLVFCHKKTGAIYVLHYGRVQGASTLRVTKFTSAADPREEFHVDGIGGTAGAIDSWSAKPRLWVGGGGPRDRGDLIGLTGGESVAVYEEDGKTFKRISEFDEDARKEDGDNYTGRTPGWERNFVVCDAIRERVYVCDFGGNRFYDLATGKPLGFFAPQGDDFAFDKRGYMHWHFNPSSIPGVARVDPNRAARTDRYGAQIYAEVPYDYGIETDDRRWLGIISTKDQLGAKFFQDGIGVNMMGDVAEQCNIYYVPRMEEEAENLIGHNRLAQIIGGDGEGDYASIQRAFQDKLRRGEQIYWIRREPGIPLAGATIWTFDRNGELRDENAVNVGELINGVQMDEDGKLYFTTSRTKVFGERAFLEGRGGVFGAPKGSKENLSPVTGSYVKTRAKAKVVSAHGPVPMDELPQRPADFVGKCWVEGGEWVYGGAEPITHGSCSCPTMRAHLDWYKRTYVPEAYRRSIGVLDTNGNLILHIGRYGNLDSGDGAKSKIPVGGDNIGIAFNAMVSGTDNYLVFDDWGERIVVLKLNYHAEETVGIGNQ